jgi:hypothetical protein
MMGRSRYYDDCPRGCDTPHPGFRHGRRTRLGGGLDGICHLGVLPLYLKQLQHVPALQITAHRLVWGCLSGMLLLSVLGARIRLSAAKLKRRPHDARPELSEHF